MINARCMIKSFNTECSICNRTFRKETNERTKEQQSFNNTRRMYEIRDVFLNSVRFSPHRQWSYLVIFMFSFVTVANIHFRSKKVLAKLLLLLFTFFRLLPGLDYPQCLVAGINTLPSCCSEELFIKKSLQRLYCSKRLFRQKALSSKSSVLVHGW